MPTTEELTENSTGIYADIQNLQEISRDVLLSLIRYWPERMPAPSKLNLYVRADHVHLWGVWATEAFPKIHVTVKGVQHYSLAATKNAADMAIAVDAISDFNHQRVSHVAVVSDDSDFISVYAKLVEEATAVSDKPVQGAVPFLWVLTDRIDTKSTLLQDFFPEKYVYIVDRFLPLYDDEPQEVQDAGPEQTSDDDEDAPDDASADSTNGHRPSMGARADMPITERIALQLIRDMPVGKFKSTDCQHIIRTIFPNHQLSAADGPTFGIIFRRDLLPFMEKRGVKEIGNQKPRQYEMTHEAKRSLARF